MKALLVSTILFVVGTSNVMAYTVGEWLKFEYRIVAAYGVGEKHVILLQKETQQGLSTQICIGDGSNFECKELN